MKDGVVYVAALNFPAYLGKLEFNYSEGSLSDATSNLVAIDATNGQIIWDVELPTGIAGPGPTISGDLLFTGSLDGIVRAFKLENGEQVWTSQTSAGLNAPFAIAGDLLLVPAGSVIIASSETPDPAPGYGPALIAYQLGATGTVTLAPSTAPSGDGSATPVAAEGEVVIEAFDLGYNPNAITIPANTDVTLTMHNTGVLAHDLVSNDGGFKIEMTDGGAQGSTTVNLAPGTYNFICSVEGHAAAGMTGTITAE
jgi:outer membrane protein assembly factor BamB